MKPHLKRTWCLGEINAQFIAQMEQILWLYRLPYDPQHPLVCFDERPCFLIGEHIEPVAMQSGRVRKEHYAYEKHGSAALLAAIEPLTGVRVAQVYSQRTGLEYTRFCQDIAAAFPRAVKIRLIQDNLNTHKAGSFYAHLPADEAFALAQRFEFYYTPKSASWLNMIEIEFAALSKQCLERRIPDEAKLRSEVLAIVQERRDKRLKIDWQFSVEKARVKLKTRYDEVRADTQKCKKT